MTTAMRPRNLLLEDVEYRWQETRFGVWRRFMYPNGELFEEFKSHHYLVGLPFGGEPLPLVHYSRGRCPETGRLVVARGVIAVGRLAIGVVAIGQASLGVIAIGQLAVGLLFGLGQASSGMFAVGQLALGVCASCGQFATGWAAVGQFVLDRRLVLPIGIN